MTIRSDVVTSIDRVFSVEGTREIKKKKNKNGIKKVDEDSGWIEE